MKGGAMNKQRVTEAELSILDEFGWKASVLADDEIELENWSPLGEDK